MSSNLILKVKPLSFPWETTNPFLFCAYHADAYPKGNSELGPDKPLSGRNIGQDFELKDGWRMYHGDKVPGFPSHPHRGFETITVVEKGLVDHADSLGAAGRYGNGDVQWMTAGKGLQHSEMFPLLKSQEANPFELFQIWLNLPKANKFVEPHFAMHWNEKIPIMYVKSNERRTTEIKLVAGKLYKTEALPPAPDSWAANPDNEVVVAVIKMDPGAQWNLPTASAEASRTLYFFHGSSLEIDGEKVYLDHSIQLKGNGEVKIINGPEESRMLLLQGKPINEEVVHYGPFVMNSNLEIQQAMQDYQKTRFGGWPWPRTDMVHAKDLGRFAKYADGNEEIPG